MNDQPQKRSRWRPRLSLRVLFVLTLVAGVYFACGRLTQSKGSRDVAAYLAEINDRPSFQTQFVAPFVYRTDSIVDSDHQSRQETMRQTYYFWMFGFIKKLPFETRQTLPVTVAVEEEFEETYFPVRSSRSPHRTAVPVSQWRSQYGD